MVCTHHINSYPHHPAHTSSPHAIMHAHGDVLIMLTFLPAPFADVVERLVALTFPDRNRRTCTHDVVERVSCTVDIRLKRALIISSACAVYLVALVTPYALGLPLVLPPILNVTILPAARRALPSAGLLELGRSKFLCLSPLRIAGRCPCTARCTTGASAMPILMPVAPVH